MASPSAVELRLSSFADRVGQCFALRVEERGPVAATLLLESAEAAGAARNGHQNFSLIFCGPEEIAIEQGMYWFEAESFGPLLIFIVPVGITAAQRVYQAVFN